MVKEQLIFEGDKPIAVILDYNEYKVLRDIAEDRVLISLADKAEAESKGTKSIEDIEEELGL